MRKQTIALSAAILSLAATGSIAVAQTGDKTLTRAEAQTRASTAFDRMDANNDGRLDQADRAARQNARFDRIDTDGNGSLSREEFAAMRSARGGEMREGRRGKRHGGWARMGGRGMMQNVDANGDGAITKAEFTAQAMTRFAAADADNDGTVTAPERKAAREAMRQAYRANRASPAN
ncbi:hypothetical protein G7A66_12475 [Altererythrobacter sp. SALINAS58]|uniref:EF-hand domain-containing protein n=1 Tax=Alteripontixanthobacter muriae TaxID=2705546 RepID=UPI001575B44B|nr:EF-hand domain-containing protein [Alteripontixanthobacter muriae]NTZ43885.1 hypothetical protein [Alteripontixanthobacter muriae]